jgi:hypothetical protein
MCSACELRFGLFPSHGQPGNYPLTVRYSAPTGAHLVFLPVGDSDRPIDRFQYNPGEQKKSVFRYAFDVLIFFPAIACLVIFTVEILSVFVVKAPLRLGHPILRDGGSLFLY